MGLVSAAMLLDPFAMTYEMIVPLPVMVKGWMFLYADIGGFLERISQFYINFYHSIIGRHVCLMHDPSAVISITDETAFEYENIPLEVVCSGERIGATIRSQQKRRPVRVAKAVNAKRVQKIFLDICKQSDKIKKQSDKIQASNA